MQRLCDKQYGLHKVHANYGRVFSEWSGIEKEMADGLQSAGHYMDVWVLHCMDSAAGHHCDVNSVLLCVTYRQPTEYFGHAVATAAASVSNSQSADIQLCCTTPIVECDI